VRFPAVLAATLLFSVSAGAEPARRTSSLGWTRLPGAEGCVPPRALAQAVERRLGRAVLAPASQADVAVEGHIERAGDGWRATITLTDAAGAPLGRRELGSQAADCRAIDDDLALVIALLIDPTAALAPPPRPPPPVDVPPPLPAALPAPAPPAPPPSPPAWRFGAAAGAAVGFGLLPRVAVGFAARAHLVPPRWPSIEIGGAVWPGNMESAGGAGATFSLAYGTLAVCPGATAAGVFFSGCVGAQVGVLHVGGLGLPLAYQQDQPVFDVTVEARARRRIVGPLLISGGVGLVVPVRRDRFYYLDAQGTARDVFQMAPLGGVIDVGLGFELP
jgi:hypothetical protein